MDAALDARNPLSSPVSGASVPLTDRISGGFYIYLLPAPLVVAVSAVELTIPRVVVVMSYMVCLPDLLDKRSRFGLYSEAFVYF